MPGSQGEETKVTLKEKFHQFLDDMPEERLRELLDFAEERKVLHGRARHRGRELAAREERRESRAAG